MKLSNYLLFLSSLIVGCKGSLRKSPLLIDEQDVWKAQTSQEECYPALSVPDYKARGLDRSDWLKQFKPCGWYQENCVNHNKAIVLKNNHNYNVWEKLKYPYIVQFDVGLDKTFYKNVYEKLSDDTRGRVFPKDDNLSIDRKTLSEYYSETIPKVGNWLLGEVCLEIPISKRLEDWGDVFDVANTMDIGRCGEDDKNGFYDSKSCIQHDVCTAYKAVLQEGDQKQGDFCEDLDCGDEGMMAITDCYIDNSFSQSPIVCDLDTKNIYSDFSAMGWAAYQYEKWSGQKILHTDACTMWTGKYGGNDTPEIRSLSR